MDTQARVERLEATIAEQEKQAAALEAEVIELRRELEPFEERYNAATSAVLSRIEAAEAAVKDMEQVVRQLRHGHEPNLEDLWKQSTYSTKREREDGDRDFSFGRETNMRLLKTQREEDIKQLYRRLARRYHPDLAKDEEDRKHRTQLMAMINEAYANNDMNALQALEDSKENEQSDALGSDLPLAVLKLRQLHQLSGELAMQIEDLKLERHELLHGELMDMKIQEKLAKGEGRDFLKDVAENLQGQYQELMRRLDELRETVTRLESL